MKVQLVSLSQTFDAKKAGCIALTPELLAATGARYSRSNEGLDAIVSRIDQKNPDASVDGIFKMVDYGHASIADMAPVAIFIDGLSLYAIHYIWSQCYTASGQESSTRYIKLNEDGVLKPQELGIANKKNYTKFVKKAFEHYNAATKVWTDLAQKDPTIMKIPKEVIEDKSEKGRRKLDRMIKNFALDRARIYLPLCIKKNAMLLMSARMWVDIISTLLSHPLKEFQSIGLGLKDNLNLETPRLTKHATYKEDSAQTILHNFQRTIKSKFPTGDGDGAFLHFYEKKRTNLTAALRTRTNRYSCFGDEARMIPINFGYKRITFAEMHDLNRHRTGQKQSTLKPNGFYDATDQAPNRTVYNKLKKLAQFGTETLKRAQKMLLSEDPTYMYYTLVGHTHQFEHTTTLDKFIYEAELRTGVGAHYRYAQHLRNALKILYKLHPEVRGLIKEGRAEPE